MNVKLGDYVNVVVYEGPEKDEALDIVAKYEALIEKKELVPIEDTEYVLQIDIVHVVLKVINFEQVYNISINGTVVEKGCIQ